MVASDCKKCPRVKDLETKIERRERRTGALEQKLEEAKRAGKRQAALFSKGSIPTRPAGRSQARARGSGPS